jgi:hypothetical protein
MHRASARLDTAARARYTRRPAMAWTYTPAAAQLLRRRFGGAGGGGGEPGPVGPAGPAGPPGPSQTVAYRHVQATAATVWTVTHDLSFWPNVTAVDSTGRAIWPGTVDYPSASSVTLTFSAAVGGEAYLS